MKSTFHSPQAFSVCFIPSIYTADIISYSHGISCAIPPSLLPQQLEYLGWRTDGSRRRCYKPSALHLPLNDQVIYLPKPGTLRVGLGRGPPLGRPGKPPVGSGGAPLGKPGKPPVGNGGAPLGKPGKPPVGNGGAPDGKPPVGKPGKPPEGVGRGPVGKGGMPTGGVPET